MTGISSRIVRIHKLSFSIALFLIFMGIIHWVRPGFIYDERGRFRPFGLGYKKCTVFPIWLVTIVLAIFSYLLVLWYIGLD
jgi:hypothetical protein|uniref:Uncharacterized protein n=1 Tax=viral metagenome TaxID=1070528 RepID=A0A6C0EL36_9ZZZZ